MTELAIAFSLSDDTGNPYWLNIELKKDEFEDGMSVGEAASFIDSLYEIEPCIDPYNLDGNNPIQTDEEPPSIDAFRDLLAQFSFPTCDMNRYGDGGYDATIKVFRSHPGTEIYKLQLSNGTASAARPKEGMVRHILEIEDAESVVLDNPIVKNPAIAWLGYDGPDIHIYGNRLHWEGKITATIVAEFWTQWDEIDIHVTGEPSVSEIIDGTLPPGYNGEGWYSGDESGDNLDDVQNVECSVIAFYHYQFSEFVLNRPEPEENVDAEVLNEICNFSLGGPRSSLEVPDDDKGVVDPQCYKDCMSRCRSTESYEECHPVCYNECLDICYREEEHISICECSKDETSSIKTYEVRCPEDVATGSHIRDARPELHYVNCGERDEVNEHAFYEETCCEPWPFDTPMPKCEKVYSKFTGVGVINGDEKERLLKQYDNISFVGVGTESGICGEIVKEQQVDQKNCCLDVVPVEWAEEVNPDSMADYSSALFYVLNGVAPYKWTVDSSEVWFAGTSKGQSIETAEPYVWVHTEHPCGVVKVSISDACNSSCSGNFRAENGTWSYLRTREWWFVGYPPEKQPWDDDRDCHEAASGGETTYVTGTEAYVATTIGGDFKFEETVRMCLNYPQERSSAQTCEACGDGLDRDSRIWPTCLPVDPDVDTVCKDTGTCVHDCWDWCSGCDGFYAAHSKSSGYACVEYMSCQAGHVRKRIWWEWTC